MANVNVKEEEKGVEALVPSLPPMLRSPKRHSGTVTPPLHAPASVPFQWEEHPGKPFPPSSAANNDAAFINISFKSLELPPRLLNSNKTSSPPYMYHVKGGKSRPRSLLESYLCLKKGQRHPLFDGIQVDEASSPSSATRLLPPIINNNTKKHKPLFLFGSLKKPGFSSFTPNQLHGSTLALSTSNTHLSPPFWATIYGALKQVIPGSTKQRNDVL